jgi:adenosine kinase
VVQVHVIGAIAQDLIASTTASLKESTKLNVKLDWVWSGLGGCAANIAYSLNLTTTHINLIAPIGSESDLIASSSTTPAGLPPDHPSGHLPGLLQLSGPMSRAIIISDPSGNQHTYFAPGAEPDLQSWQSHLDQQVISPADIVIQAPQQPSLMRAGLAWARQSGAQVFWSPGQYADQMASEDIDQCMGYTDVLFTNTTEANYLAQTRTQRKNLGAAYQVITNGSDAVEIRAHQQHLAWVAVPEVQVTDPTGCGDAFVSGFAQFLLATVEIPPPTDHLLQAAAMGIEYAQSCLAVFGCQNHASPRVNPA